MKDQLKTLEKQALEAIKQLASLDACKTFYDTFLGKKGSISELLKGLKTLPEEERKDFGALLNAVKQDVESIFHAKQEEISQQESKKQAEGEWSDLSLVSTQKKGAIHPLFQVQYDLEDLFQKMGFMVLDGPELESEYYNFDALNIPPIHPARESQDTFYVDPIFSPEDLLLLRTQTSSVQVRAMKKYGAPLRAIVPGKVFRNEATDASHDHTFDQMEGLVIDKNISISHLIAVMKELLSGIFEKDVVVRMRPGFFPFVEPGFELDIQCLICDGKGCSVCKHSSWVELIPCGMVHPKVIEAGGLDPKIYSGFAFGMGLTRLVMMRYGIHDIRLLRGGDIRFLEQFSQ